MSHLPEPEASAEDLRAVLWDLDGTLLDSSALHCRAWQETMAGEGVTFTVQMFWQYFGQRNDHILRQMLGARLTGREAGRIAGAKEERYRALVRSQGVALMPGAAGWLSSLAAAGWRQALATSAPRLNVDTVLEVLGLPSAFQTIVAAEDVMEGKPDPAVFLLAARRLAVPPARCVVVEDAPAGIEAARRGRLRVIGVGPEPFSPPPHWYSPSLTELPPDIFVRLLIPEGRCKAGPAFPA